VCPRRESNPHQQLRRLLLYPLSYGDSDAIQRTLPYHENDPFSSNRQM
jgi:hypothetical protein